MRFFNLGGIWLGGCLLALAGDVYVEKSSIPSPQATQAAAVDGDFVYAVSSKVIAKIERASGVELGTSQGEASHLNSAFVIDGKIHCAHSNFPLKPEKGDIRVLDPGTMKLSVFHLFDNPPGSVTWVLKRDGNWWCHFAHYGKDNWKSVLLRYDGTWKETGRWKYPPELVADWGEMSLSGAIWHDDFLLATGHDKKVVYRLKVEDGEEAVVWVDTLPSPFPGQGIAVDPQTGGLAGIDRKRKSVVFAELEKK